MARFLERLFQDGEVDVRPGPIPDVDNPAMEILSAAESAARAEVAFSAPDLSLPCAGWAARLFYAGCQFTVCRDVSREEIARTLSERCPEDPLPARVWSVDLTFRYLPDLFRLARHVSPTDPLIQELRVLATSWPLSSVGIPDLGEPDPSAILSTPALRQLYVDRVIERGDVSRLAHPIVAEGVRTALGAHPGIAPVMARALDIRTPPAGPASQG